MENVTMKLIPGYDCYFVASDGSVYSNKTGKLKRLTPKGRFNQKRYLQVCLSSESGVKYYQIHRLVALAFCDGYFDGAVVNHKDSNIHNNNSSNLEWITQKENINKSYASSGMNQVRNYDLYNLFDPHGQIIGVFKGRNEPGRFLNSIGLKISESSLSKYGKCKGYRITKVDNGVGVCCNDYPQGVHLQ